MDDGPGGAPYLVGPLADQVCVSTANLTLGVAEVVGRLGEAGAGRDHDRREVVPQLVLLQTLQGRARHLVAQLT
jgi:hypothetical protein